MPTEARIFIAALAFRLASSAFAFLANVVFTAHQDQGFGVFAGRDQAVITHWGYRPSGNHSA